jgi:hypothetical protein
MAQPSEDPIRTRLRERGAAEHVIRGGAEGLISRWRDFVGEVERGYTLGLEDYRNDLDIRSLIAFAGLSAKVEAEDARLRGMLIPARRDIWSTDTQDAFWVRGYPRNASDELRQDLEVEGLIAE